MAWYYGTFSCGHEGRVNIIGPAKQRQWKKERAFEKVCPECWEKHLKEERQKANEEALEKAKEMELPELTGSPKQVAWANTLRQDLIDEFEKLDDLRINLSHTGVKLKNEDLLKVQDYILVNKTDARYYIDNRDKHLFDIVKNEYRDALKSDEEKYQEELLEKERIESIVYPENKTTDSPVEIEYTETDIQLKFHKDYDFIDIVKDGGYRWNGNSWYRKLSATTGSYKDRVAEIGNVLLNNGYPVMILDEGIRNNAINGIFEEECTRWIYARVSGKYKGCFAIMWRGRNNNLYEKARSLPGSRWDSAVIVKVEHYKEVEEFAELYGFKFTEGAKKLIDEYKKLIKNAKIVNPAEVNIAEHEDGLEEILESNNDILEDLRDD